MHYASKVGSFQAATRTMAKQAYHVMSPITGCITKIDHGSESIFFTDKGRQWVMIFTGTEVDGVWDMTPDDWSEAAQDQNEARSVGACFGWR